jgi:hypothetical protein
MLGGPIGSCKRSVDFEACLMENQALKNKLSLKKILLLTSKEMCAVHACDLYDDRWLNLSSQGHVILFTCSACLTRHAPIFIY